MTASETLQEAMALIDQAVAILNRGPLEFTLRRLVEHSQALIASAKLRVGDRAVIVRQIECVRGWRGCEKTLAIGQIGEVVDVDYYDGRFRFAFVPDHQWYKHYNTGEYLPRESKNSYCLRECHLARIDAREKDAKQ